jgi:hypothetical protein
MARRIAAFFYGLFMDAELLRAKGVNPNVLGSASIAGFGLRIGERAAVVPDGERVVHGVVMDLTHAELDSLYAEESVRMYRPEAVIATLRTGAFIPALCFNLVDAPSPDESNPQYAGKLRELARRLGLPSGYVESIGSEAKG